MEFVIGRPPLVEFDVHDDARCGRRAAYSTIVW
jgi:hypothetical protein